MVRAFRWPIHGAMVDSPRPYSYRRRGQGASELPAYSRRNALCLLLQEAISGTGRNQRSAYAHTCWVFDITLELCFLICSCAKSTVNPDVSPHFGERYYLHTLIVRFLWISPCTQVIKHSSHSKEDKEEEENRYCHEERDS